MLVCIEIARVGWK